MEIKKKVFIVRSNGGVMEWRSILLWMESTDNSDFNVSSYWTNSRVHGDAWNLSATTIPCLWSLGNEVTTARIYI